MKAHAYLYVVLATGLLLAGCSRDGNSPVAPKGEPPALPPTASMQIDLGYFDAGAYGLVEPGASEVAKDGVTMFHWWNAALRLMAVRLFTNAALTPPSLAFAAALHTPPTQQPDGAWIWVYTWVQGAKEVQIRLRGIIVGDRVEWELRLTDPAANPPLDRTLWFEGETALANDEGRWLFYDLGTAGFPELAGLEWQVKENGDREIRLGCRREGSPEYGDRLGFEIAGTNNVVRFHDESEQTDAEIRWDSATGAGSIAAPDYNGGQRGCWDTRHQDTVCTGGPGR